MPTTTIPLTAWEQIGVVVIFTLLVLGLAFTMSKILVSGYLSALNGINNSFSDVIKQNDARWKIFLDTQLEADNERTRQFVIELKGLFQLLTLLNTNTSDLRSLLIEHESAAKRRHLTILRLTEEQIEDERKAAKNGNETN